MYWVIEEDENPAVNLINFFKKQFEIMAINVEISKDKAGRLNKILASLFGKYKLSVEQLLIDLLEEFDYMMLHIEKHPYDLEITLDEMKAKAKSIKTELLGDADKNLLLEIQNIQYSEL